MDGNAKVAPGRKAPPDGPLQMDLLQNRTSERLVGSEVELRQNSLESVVFEEEQLWCSKKSNCGVRRRAIVVFEDEQLWCSKKSNCGVR